MQDRMIANEYRTTAVCVDSYENKVPEGRLYNPYLNGAAHFDSLMQMLLQLDGLLDEMRFPQPFDETRSFAPVSAPPLTIRPDQAEPKGKLATFLVKILFRQNASWQGSVVWKEQRREESFRSVLELLLLMNSALAGEKETDDSEEKM